MCRCQSLWPPARRPRPPTSGRDMLTLGASVRGAAHRRAHLPNQDALRVFAGEKGTVLALADGHGSDRCFRSDVGARLAVGVAARVLGAAVDGGWDLGELEIVARVTQGIVHEWRLAAANDLRLFPLTVDERTRAEERHPLLAYGSTLCAVAITLNRILYLQLGDGDILTISRNGGVRRPLPPDERLFANQTTSLCSPR